MSLGPFDLPGPEFLLLYVTLLFLVIAAGRIIPRWLKPEGRDGMIHDPDQLALLGGGKMRLADTVVARMLQKGLLAVPDKHGFAIGGLPSGQNALERAVLALPSPLHWPTLATTIAGNAAPVERALIDRGLLMDQATMLQMRFWQTLPYLMLLVFGATKWEVGTLRDKPVGFLTILLVITAVLAVVRWVRIDRLTRGGRAVLRRARDQADRLRRAPLPQETDLAVALFGTTVLVGSSWSGFHTMRSQPGSDGGSSGGGGDGGGGSGCGGGGCGGCGGG
ncbi:TIGR04222 domain-containing membrane protein [Sphingomonas alpina]|uniref:TIGR04222 domain-containing membrane protein n=1 Tax=Sphingomonas alpina TaxID=653931 RepID=A0A7H0LH01_9SPHN|nr:TIGR04222 domain-containing membrane protein [Sphingomonas alpina]QNQ08954.1 TIGR04222 domain-containing membrane protein [Sphingomonas alpina]